MENYVIPHITLLLDGTILALVRRIFFSIAYIMVGAFQCYDKYMLENLSNHAAASHKEYHYGYCMNLLRSLANSPQQTPSRMREKLYAAK